ncbi:MAG: prepilin-type N-terminal cleavage/methylation domain-containing protein [Alphaproteobacteria bacterium]|nr:prepilin-type N-terminal cleavage/methylation domain-containing protein [Alphaproteobacteria bacterium]
MKTPFPSRRTTRAFTLIELSIVLVIIGLLVGGIASFNSYSRNARLSTLMNESKILITAFGQFQDRYGAPPGDYSVASSAWTGAGNGDGNGLIRAGVVALPLERYYVFQHLALAGFIQGTYTGAVNANGGATIGLNVVGGAVDTSAFIFDHPDALDGVVSGDPLYFDGFYGNLLRVAGVIGTAATIPDQPFLTPKQAYQIDDKFDDGLPALGNVTSPKSTALANCAASDLPTATYTTGNDTRTCYLFLRMP